jgi:hypothetical protein
MEHTLNQKKQHHRACRFGSIVGNNAIWPCERFIQWWIVEKSCILSDKTSRIMHQEGIDDFTQPVWPTCSTEFATHGNVDIVWICSRNFSGPGGEVEARGVFFPFRRATSMDRHSSTLVSFCNRSGSAGWGTEYSRENLRMHRTRNICSGNVLELASRSTTVIGRESSSTTDNRPGKQCDPVWSRNSSTPGERCCY